MPQLFLAQVRRIKRDRQSSKSIIFFIYFRVSSPWSLSFVLDTSLLRLLASRVLPVTMALDAHPIRFLKLQLRTTAEAPECCFPFRCLCWGFPTHPSGFVKQIVPTLEAPFYIKHKGLHKYIRPPVLKTRKHKYSINLVKSKAYCCYLFVK